MSELGKATVGRHGFLRTPCSANTFRIIYGHEHPHRGCSGNPSEAPARHGIAPDQSPICCNILCTAVLSR